MGGVLAVKELIPPAYKHLLRGPRLMVDFNKGVVSELVLTFLMTFFALIEIFKGPSNAFVRTWLIILAIYVVILSCWGLY